MKSPCQNCERRYVGCHSECEEYKKYDEENARKRRQRLIDARNVEYFGQHPRRKI